MFGPSNAPPSSVVFVSPRTIAPAAFSLATSVASAAGSVVLERDRAAAGRQADDVDRVVDDHRDAGERPERLLRSTLAARRFRAASSTALGLTLRIACIAGPVGVGERDPVELGLDQLLRGERPCVHQFASSCPAEVVSSENGRTRRLAPELFGDRLVVGVAVPAAGERLRGNSAGAAVERRIDHRRRLLHLRQLFDHVADADHVELVVGAAGDVDADRPPLRRGVAAGHHHLRHAGLRRARHRTDRPRSPVRRHRSVRSSSFRSPTGWRASGSAGFLRILSGFSRRRRLPLQRLFGVRRVAVLREPPAGWCCRPRSLPGGCGPARSDRGACSTRRSSRAPRSRWAGSGFFRGVVCASGTMIAPAASSAVTAF